MIIKDLWDCQVNAIIDVKHGDADTDMYKYKPMTSLLARWENTMKYKHRNHSHDQQKHSSMFVLSVDRMLGRKTLVVLYILIRFMA